MPTIITSNTVNTLNSLTTLKQQFAIQLKDNSSIYDYLTIYENAQLVMYPENFEYIKNKYQYKTDYIVSCAFDFFNDYTEIDFDDPNTLQNLDFEKLSDTVYEYADSQCDIYFYKAYRTAALFAEYIDEVMENYGFAVIMPKNQSCPFYHLIVAGQNEFYSQFARFVLEELQTFVEELEIETHETEENHKTLCHEAV